MEIETEKEIGKELQPITQELIRGMRYEGRVTEANDLLILYRKDVKKAGKQAVADAMKVDRIIKKFFGICHMNNCSNHPEEGYSTCRKCLDYKYNQMGRNMIKNYKSIMKKEGITMLKW